VVLESADEERELRAGRNQSLFRAVNEENISLNKAFSEFTETYYIACECADTACVDVLPITPGGYEEVRRNSRHFAVLPGHVYLEVEGVVAYEDGYTVVEKTARCAVEIVEATDRRAVPPVTDA